MLLSFVKESSITLEIIGSKERETSSKQRDPRNTLYIRNNLFKKYLNKFRKLIFKKYIIIIIL